MDTTFDAAFREKLADTLTKANQAFDRIMEERPDLYNEQSRNNFVLGWIEGAASGGYK